MLGIGCKHEAADWLLAQASCVAGEGLGFRYSRRNSDVNLGGVYAVVQKVVADIQLRGTERVKEEDRAHWPFWYLKEGG
jgi:hypothetical protein